MFLLFYTSATEFFKPKCKAWHSFPWSYILSFWPRLKVFWNFQSFIKTAIPPRCEHSHYDFISMSLKHPRPRTEACISWNKRDLAPDTKICFPCTVLAGTLFWDYMFYRVLTLCFPPSFTSLFTPKSRDDQEHWRREYISLLYYSS